MGSGGRRRIRPPQLTRIELPAAVLARNAMVRGLLHHHAVGAHDFLRLEENGVMAR